jgi:TolB-like protein/Tfp pilus assembly protein PilF
MSLAVGTRLGPYEILVPLGAGGMGEVYRARDKKLDRDVAIKVLPQSVAADPDTLARFEREAKSVAALSHQNILAIHDFGDQDGIAYAVMELLEGETLREKLDAGLIPRKQAVDYALQVAKGLSAAHEKGIVHRDLKPENLFVSRDGHLKILDFGLAKRVEAVAPGKETSAPTGSGHTEPGTVMGTVGYMSPEQVKGFAVDHRSDIFSFGAILYELLSGKKAFRRETNAETMAAILRDEPEELTASARNIPPALERIVKHCLEKDREHRFQSARDIAFNLSEQFSPAATGSPRESTPPIGSTGLWVAVLPFKYGGADADLAALADGLSEEIGTGLSRFRYLSVVASASAARLKGEAGDERALAAKLGARYVLEGSIRGGGSAIRVSAQLVDAQTGAQLWSETFNRALQAASVLEAQDDIAARIVATVADSYGVLVHSLRSATRQKDDVDLTPVDWQFQYFAYREQITPSAHAALKSRLERVVERDDRRSDLWACLAQIYVDEYSFGFPGADAASLDRALTAARRAVELDRANQFALVALAQTHFFRQDLAAFGPAAERAMALNPLNTDAVGILGLQIVHTGEFERGAAIVRRAMELNANHAGWMHFAPLWEHFHKGEYEQALERANRVDVPGLFWPYLVMASACGHLGRQAEAEAAVRDLLALDPEFAAHARSNVGTWHFASGLMEPILEGLRKAGLSIPATDGSSESPRRAGAVTAKADRRAPGTHPGPARAEEGFWVAVLPFKYGGADTSLKTLAEGLTEEIVTGLSRFSYLRVISRGSAPDAQSAGKELGARYIMEGSLRQAGTRLRLAVQLVDAVSGAHLWAENYERIFRPDAVFELQDELVPRIVSTVADMHGVLPRSMSEVVRLKSADQMSPYEALLRSFGYNERFTPEDLAEVRTCLERAVQQSPGNAECWAMLSLMYANEYGHWDNAGPDSLDRSLRAARTAVEAAPLHSLPYYALAQALFFKREIPAFRVAAERAVSLNPMDGATAAFMGLLIAYAGDWERGCALSDKGSQLNPNHPGWYRYTAWHDAYRKKDYRKALEVALRLNAPKNYYTHAVLAICYAQLGQMEEARSALRDMLALKPNYAEVARELHGRWIDPDLVEQLMDGLRKAGLEIAPKGRAAAPALAPADSSAQDASGAARAEEGFWVAVLPFRHGGTDSSLTALAEGLTEEIVTGLSRFSYLKVIARSSTSRYAHESVDVRSAGKELGARYVMEGTLRQAGAKLRLAVQLLDAVSGAHLWAENYERAFSPEAVFDLQDDLVPRIVSTVADMHGILPRTMSESLRSRTPEQLSPYEAVMRSFGYSARVTPEELAAARSGLELAVQRAPAYPDAWAMLAWLCIQDYAQSFNLQADSLASGLTAARRAVEAAPSNHLAHCMLAQALFFHKEFQSFRNAAERAVVLNPMNGDSMAFLGELLTYAGDWEHGLELAGRAKQLNPNHPGWYWYADFYDAYRRGDDRGALDATRKVNLPGQWFSHAATAAACGQLGDRNSANKALKDLLKLRPDFAATVRGDIEKWWEPEYVERLINGWRKAGLEIPTETGTS